MINKIFIKKQTSLLTIQTSKLKNNNTQKSIQNKMLKTHQMITTNKSFCNNNTIFYLLVLCSYFCLIAECFNFKQLGRTQVSKVINQKTSYSFIFYRSATNSGSPTAWNTQTVPSNGNISVQFPTDYILSGNQTCDSLQITTSTVTLTLTSYNCTVNGNRIIFENALTSIPDYFIRQARVTFGKILNPSPAIKTKQFVGYLGIDVAVAAGTTSLQLDPAVFTNCSLKFGNDGFVNSSSPAIFSLINLNALNTTSTIRLSFPTYKYWINDISATLLPITQGAMSCSPLSLVQTSIACTGSFNNFTVLASSLFSSSIVSGSTFSFQINNFVSPPTLQAADSIKITSLTNGYEVDTCFVTATDLKPRGLMSLTITPVDGSIIVNEKIGLSINMTLSDTIDQFDTFRITFPNSISVSYTNVTTSGSAEGPSSLSGKVLSVAMDTTIEVKFWRQQFFVINFYTVTAPPSIKQSDLITVQVLRNGYQKMIGTKSITATQSTLTGSVNPQNLLVNNKTVYTFNIALKDGLSLAGWLEIVFPSTIILPTSISSTSLSGTGMKTNPTITVNSLQNKLIINDINGSLSNIAPQNFTLSVGLISNPGSTKQTGQFNIKSYYQLGTQYLVAQGSLNGINPTAGIIKSEDITITKTSDIVLATAVQYKIGFVITFDIPVNGKIKLQIPNDIKIDLSNLQTNCFQQINITGTKISSTCTGVLNPSTSKYQITITSIALNNKVDSGSTIFISLQNICTNPDTTRNIQGFGIYTYDQQNFLIQSATTGISTRANTPSQCLSVSIDRVSRKNSEITNYTVLFKQSSNLLPLSVLQLTLPSKLELSANTYCMEMTGSVNLTCTIVANLITIRLSNATVINMTVFGVLIVNVLNTATFQPLIQSFLLLTKTPDTINRYCQYSTGSTPLQNNQASSFSNITGVFTPRIYNQITSLIISVKPSPRVVPSFFILSIAAQLNVQSLSCSYQGIVSGNCSEIVKNSIRVSGIFTSNPMQFTISGLRAPKYRQNISQFSSVSSFSNNSHKIDESTNLIAFAVLCTLPCKTCSLTNLSQCLSCYHDSNISTQSYYLTDTKWCYSVCPDSYYSNNITLQCQKCNSICKTCNISSTNCLTCLNTSTSPYFFYNTSTTTGTCMNLCPNKYYPNAIQVCVQCQTPCKQCTAKTTCTSCLPTFYMYNGTCRTTCPIGKTIANIITNVCDPCSTVCDTCSISLGNCTTCSPDSASLNGTCVSSCPPPLVIKSGSCSTCDTICKQCSLKSSNCTKCDTSSQFKYLFNNTCLENCPQTYYKDIINGLCKLCQTLNIGCKNCSSMSTCLSCDTGFIFLLNKCYNYTPLGYYDDNGIAKPCTGDCATCIDFATKCTSCLTKNLQGNDCIPTCPLTKVPQNKICVNCESPCSTCFNIKTNCTSCIPNLVPKVYLNNFYCTQTCPNYTYGNSTTNLCVQCKQPCLTCISDADCKSCVNGKYLMGNQCLNNCTSGFIGLNKICQPCTGPCLTCQIQQTRCLTCQASYFLYNSSAPTCLQNCSSVGLYPDVLSQICTGCQLPCLTCVNFSNTCTSCNSSSLLLFKNKCVPQCPQNYYAVSSDCLDCPIQCRTCTSSSVCQSCKLNFYLHLNFCVDKCPIQYPVITAAGQCAKCSDNACKNCSQTDYCLQCQIPFYLHLGKCVERCPTSYKQIIDTNTSLRGCVYDPAANTTEASINKALKSGGNLFPVPFTIAAAFIGIATIMSKFQNQFTFVSGVLYSLYGILEWGSIAVALLLFNGQYGFYKIQFYIIGGSFAFLYALNLLALLIQNIYLLGDQNFKKWTNLGSNRCFYYLSSFIGFIATHKFKNFMFSKMFNFIFLKARLDSVQKFRIFNVFTFLSFLSSAGVIFGLSLIFSTYTLAIDQQLMAYIDAIILTAINIILAILNSKKDNDFFEQKTEDGYIVNKRIQDNDQFLYGDCIPMATQQKFDFNQRTTGKLVTDFQSKYRRLASQIGEQSVRNISIQVQPILGDQSRITHLNSEDLSNLDLFQRKQVSIQFDQAPPEVQDRSINPSFHQKHQISIQMDHVSQNQISIQVQRQNEQVSVQYAPNLLDQEVGMSRQHAEISIQYSAKPVFINMNKSYRSQQQLQDFEELNETQNAFSNQQTNNRQENLAVSGDQEVSQFGNNQSKSYARGIKKPDSKLKAQLQLDINERIRMRQQQLARIQQQRRKQQRMQAVANFQKKKHYQEEQASLSKDDQYAGVQTNKNNKGRNQLDNLYQNEDTTNKFQQGQSVMDSKYDIMNNNKDKQFSSNQSRIKKNQHSGGENSFQGQKTEEYIIQMLSGQKTSTNQNQQLTNNFNNLLQNQSNTKRRILKVQSKEELQDSNEISLNMTAQIEQQNNQHMLLNKNNGRGDGKYKFQNKNLSFNESGSEKYQENNYANNHNRGGQQSQQYTKSISTKFISTQNWKPPLPKGLQRELDSSQDIQNSYIGQNDLTRDIINGPIQPSHNNNKVTNHNKNNKYLNQSSNQQQLHYEYKNRDKKTNIVQLLRQNKNRNLKSATLVRNQRQNSRQLNQYDDSFQEDQMMEQYQVQEKQQPLPPLQQGENDQNYDLEFQENQKVFISPFESQQNQGRINQDVSKLNQSKNMPQGVGLKNMKFRTNSNKKLPAHKSQTLIQGKRDSKSFSRSRQRPVRQKPLYNQLLNPSQSIKLKFTKSGQKNSKSIENINKQLQKQQKKVENRKRNYELMLDRPSNSKKAYSKQQNQNQRLRKNSVEKIYLNKPNNI